MNETLATAPPQNEECERVFGYSLLQRYQRSRATLCAADCSTNSTGPLPDPTPDGRSAIHVHITPTALNEVHFVAAVASNVLLSQPYALLGQPGAEGECARNMFGVCSHLHCSCLAESLCCSNEEMNRVTLHPPKPPGTREELNHAQPSAG